MKRWDLAGVHDGDEAARLAVSGFLDALARGDLADARAGAAAAFTWFGEALDDARWTSDAARAFFAAPMTVDELRCFPVEVARALPDVAQLLDGPLPDDAQLVLADVTRDGRRVTLGAVVSGGAQAPRVARVFDPTDLAAATQARARGAARS